MGVQLPRWVWMGAGSLAFIAGMVNAVGYLGFAHQAVSHLTGTTSLLAATLVAGDRPGGTLLAGVALCFVTGAALSGMIIQDSTLRLGRRYGVALTLESILLLCAIPLFREGRLAGPCLAAMACGLQNAMATTYSGAVVRTAHLSGMFTDLGIGLGHAIRDLPLQRRRLLLSGLIIGCFFAGGLAAAALFQSIQYDALFVPAALTGITGAGYAVFRRNRPESSA